MDNKVDVREKKSKKFLALALAFLVVVAAVFSAGMFFKKNDTKRGLSNEIVEQISQILELKDDILSAKDSSKLVELNNKIKEVSDTLDKIKEEDLKSDEAKAKLQEVKEKFAKIKEVGELAGLISKLSEETGVNSETIDELKQNEKLKNLGETLGEYKSKLDEFKSKYAEKGEDVQAVLDYSALESQAEAVKEKLQEVELPELTSDEIESFYDKIEELKEIISK